MLTNGAVQIDFLTAEFALQRIGPQTTTPADPGAFAEYLAAVLNPSSQNEQKPHDERPAAADRIAAGRTDDAYRTEEQLRSDADAHRREKARLDDARWSAEDARQGDESARAHASEDAGESTTRNGHRPERDGDAEAEAKTEAEAKRGAMHGEGTRSRGEDADAQVPSDDEDPQDVIPHGADGVGSRDHRLVSALTRGSDYAGDRPDSGESTRGSRLEARIDEHGRPFIEFDVAIDPEARGGTDGEGRPDRRPSVAGAARRGSSADAQSAEVASAGLRRLPDEAGDGRERRDRRAGDRVHRVEIRDLRTRASGRVGAGASGQDRGGSSADRSQDSSGSHTSFDRSTSGPQGASLGVLDLHPSGEEDSSGESSAHTASPASARGGSGPAQTSTQSPPHPGSAASQLRQALQEHLNADIVRSARLIIRNQDSGEIRLHLKPEQLGSVRISLQMQDGHIAGRIIVDNQTVREAFEQNLASLQRAFQDSGLEASGVEVSVADSGGRQDGDGDGGPRAGRPSPGTAADRFGQAVADLVWYDEQHELVDLVV